MRSISLLLAAGLALVPLFALAAPRSIKECEQIKQADAYNECLASFGPVVPGLAARERAFTPNGPPPEASVPEPMRGKGATLRRHRGRHIGRMRRARHPRGMAIERRHGRVRTVIEIPGR